MIEERSSGLEPEDDGVRRPDAESVPLLPGEDPDSVLPDDVEHWIAVYEELAGFLQPRGDPGSLQRYRRRLDYWRQRRG